MESTLSNSAPHLSSHRSLPLYPSMKGLAVLSRYISGKGIDVGLLVG